MPSVYSLPQIYDIAFDFRDVAGECDFLLKAAEQHLGRKVESAIELACGPGYHVREMAKRGLVSHGMDNSPEIVSYANELITDEHVNAAVHLGDMRYWQATGKYDLAYILIASFAHLLTNQDILDHFDCVADLLTPGGIYTISTAHPRDFWRETSPNSDESSWTNQRDGITVTTNWGGNNQQFNPLTEIDEVVISFAVESGGQTTRHYFPERLRRLSYQTFLSLVKQSGRFEIVDAYGDFDLSTKFSSESDSVRFVPVLKLR